MTYKVAIMMHSHTRREELNLWAIFYLAQCWREDGIKVSYLLGPDERKPADVLIMHVDMTVVPDEYMAVADLYPVSVNGKVKDIRKSSFSRHIVGPDDDYDGPVIVKSNFNCAGAYERLLASRQGTEETAAPRHPFRLLRQSDYRIYPSRNKVPAEYFFDANLVVEKFLPERENDIYFTRSHHFFGSRSTTVRLGSHAPIVLGHNKCIMQSVEPHPEILEFRKNFHLDYGKIDYVEHNGHAVVFDVNKTTGEGGVSRDPAVLKMRRSRARGIFDYLHRS